MGWGRRLRLHLQEKDKRTKKGGEGVRDKHSLAQEQNLGSGWVKRTQLRMVWCVLLRICPGSPMPETEEDSDTKIFIFESYNASSVWYPSKVKDNDISFSSPQGAMLWDPALPSGRAGVICPRAVVRMASSDLFMDTLMKSSKKSQKWLRVGRVVFSVT